MLILKMIGEDGSMLTNVGTIKNEYPHPDVTCFEYDGGFLNTYVSTTGLRGGDAGHGGKTRIVLQGNGDFCFTKGELTENNSGTEVMFEVAGDWELQTLAEAFNDIAKELTKQICHSSDNSEKTKS